MRTKPIAGLLPLYLKLYDDAVPEARPKVEAFLKQVANGLAAHGIEVVSGPVCRVKPEFDAAVRQFEKADADIIVTLHLAYSPSLESIDILCGTRLPILVLDTTPDFSFDQNTDPARIMYNHGIHGVQDMTSMLRRRGRPYEIVAGHWEKEPVLARAAGVVRAAHAARRFRSSRILRIGESFCGMGDFYVDADVLEERLGISVKQVEPRALAALVQSVSEAEVDAEIAHDRECFDVIAPDEVHRRSVRLGLGLRRCIEREGVGAFSVNFLAFDTPDGPVNTVPFLEISKAMERGIGYAGEGDVLTAALVGALASAFPETTFTEIFCPDWNGGSIFLSHMGEINPAVAARRPLLCEKPFPYTPAANPAFIACAPKPGPAVLVNLSPGPDDSFRLIVAPVNVLEDSSRADMQNIVRGWIRPKHSTAKFLEDYSRLGGTHHSALVLGDRTEAIAAFARFAGLECCLLEE